MNVRIVAFFLLLALLICSRGAGSNEGEETSPFNVGYQVLDFDYPKGKYQEALTVAVWYPTEAPAASYNYGGAASGNIAIDASPYVEASPYPLLVFSHGYGGSGIGVAFLAEALVARGWIVAAPDHHDKHSAVRIRTGPVSDYDRQGLLQHAMQIAASGVDDREAYAYRLDEMQLALDGMLTSDSFGNLVDLNRIAVGGHSFGGFTALGVCGTIPERYDAHLKAVLLFSTGAGGYFFTDEELASLTIPSMLFLGEREREARRGRDMTMTEIAEKVYRNMPPPKYFLEVKGANHLSFNNQFTSGLVARWIPGNDEQIFDVIRRYAIAFLEKHVAGMPDFDHVLEQSHPMLTRYDRKPRPNE